MNPELLAKAVSGIDPTCAIVIDCKHWKRADVSSLSSYAKKQLERPEVLQKKQTNNITSAIPILVTLHYEKSKLCQQSPCYTHQYA